MSNVRGIINLSRFGSRKLVHNPVRSLIHIANVNPHCLEEALNSSHTLVFWQLKKSVSLA